MSSYQKFTLGTFKKKLEGGDYENATGANRAIGKTQELSEKDRAKAKAMVAAHFGTEPAKAKPAKKASKAAKKVGKAKVAKAPAKKAKAKPAKKTAVKPTAVPKPAKKAAKRSKKKASKRSRASAAAASVTEPEPAAAAPAPARAKALPRAAHVELPQPPRADVSRDRIIEQMGNIISHVDTVVKSMELSKQLFPKGVLEKNVTSAQSVLGKAVGVLDSVVSPMLSEKGESALPPAAAAKSSSKKGKRGTKAITASAEITEAVAVEQEGAVDINDPSLTEDEREEIRLARKVKPAVDRRYGNTTPEATA